MQQDDLFATSAPTAPPRDPAYVAATRARLAATLALVQAAQAMPWPDLMTIIREDNAFRYGKDVLPSEEGERMWAAFDVEMDRLYAIMNEGKEVDTLADLD